jgi:hypothetical protein
VSSEHSLDLEFFSPQARNLVARRLKTLVEFEQHRTLCEEAALYKLQMAVFKQAEFMV